MVGGKGYVSLSAFFIIGCVNRSYYSALNVPYNNVIRVRTVKVVGDTDGCITAELFNVAAVYGEVIYFVITEKLLFCLIESLNSR